MLWNLVFFTNKDIFKLFASIKPMPWFTGHGLIVFS